MSQTGIGIAFTPTRNQTSTVIRFTQTKNILPLQPTCCNKHFLYDNHQLQYDIYEPTFITLHYSILWIANFTHRKIRRVCFVADYNLLIITLRYKIGVGQNVLFWVCICNLRNRQLITDKDKKKWIVLWVLISRCANIAQYLSILNSNELLWIKLIPRPTYVYE